MEHLLLESQMRTDGGPLRSAVGGAVERRKREGARDVGRSSPLKAFATQGAWRRQDQNGSADAGVGVGVGAGASAGAMGTPVRVRKERLLGSRTSSRSNDSNATAGAFICSLDLEVLRGIATATRRKQLGTAGLEASRATSSGDVPCTVLTPPKIGGYNVAFEVEFTDGISWMIRVPMSEWTPADVRCMRHDIITMEFIASRTSVPVPAIHSYSCDTNNALRHPYIVTDKVRGTRLIEVWNEPAWWTVGERRKEHLFESLAGYMTELAQFKFDKIGRLDRRQPDGSYFVAPFPSGFGILGEDGPHEEFGPFESTHAYLTGLLALRRQKSPQPNPQHAMLQLFIGGLPDPRYDSPPFTLGHPDFDSQNIFIDDKTGRVVGIIDWDGVSLEPQQLGALMYPAWLTVDWDPIMYDRYQDLPNCDTEEDLHRYREMYTEAVRIASGGTMHTVTQNSHVVSSLYLAIASVVSMTTVLFRLGEYAFGSDLLAYRLLEGIEHSGWFTGSPEEVATVKREFS
ncbi:hypothetical protein C8Q79DRAFT_1011231 [Trametes meyenii]|nr:hypothetical protein C8Q79DRAFT_1011231 [Trametes meyenii]